MSTGTKVAGFVVAAVAVFAVAIGIGRVVGPIEADSADEHGHADDDRIQLTPAGEGHDHGAGGHAEHGATAEAHSLRLERSVYDAGRQQLAFAVLAPDGKPVASYELTHEKLLHLVVVRRDLGGFRHVHPTLDRSTGQWTTSLDLDAGDWRVYADFTPKAGEQTVAEADLSVAGEYAPRELPAEADVARVDGYEVRLAREDGMLAFRVSRGGAPVTDLQPYLGAYGHLVAISASDMGYTHVHPEGSADEAAPADGEVAFHAELADTATYRLFLEFRHRGAVHRAEFTVGAAADGGHAHDEGGQVPPAHDDDGGHGEPGGGGHDDHTH